MKQNNQVKTSGPPADPRISEILLSRYDKHWCKHTHTTAWISLGLWLKMLWVFLATAISEVTSLIGANECYSFHHWWVYASPVLLRLKYKQLYKIFLFWVQKKLFNSRLPLSVMLYEALALCAIIRGHSNSLHPSSILYIFVQFPAFIRITIICIHL